MITGTKSKPSDYHDKIDYERVFKYNNFRVALYILDHQQLNTLISTLCTEDLKNILLKDGSLITSIRNGSDLLGLQLWSITLLDVTAWDNMIMLHMTSFISQIEMIK